MKGTEAAPVGPSKAGANLAKIGVEGIKGIGKLRATRVSGADTFIFTLAEVLKRWLIPLALSPLRRPIPGELLLH